MKFAYLTFLMLNDSYLPGVLVQGYAFQKQNTVNAELVCLITKEITASARTALKAVYDHVVEVKKIYIPYKRKQQRQYVPYVFTRLHSLRLGKDGDLGFEYDRIISTDADLLPLKNYCTLFKINVPAGILNEKKIHFIETDKKGNYLFPEDIDRTKKWKWHHIYDPICPHGTKIPKSITDRPKIDPANRGVHSALQVFKPDKNEYKEILRDLKQPETLKYVTDLFEWPDMQYLTIRWSGKWTNIDVKYAGLNGYPKLSLLYGTHFGGIKPWQFKKEQAIKRWGRYDDFQCWYQYYLEMVKKEYPELLKNKRLNRLRKNIRKFFNFRAPLISK